ncbi:hypothetical protein KSP40_PGU014702 [Platanthera guangdongensis]|uniref:Saposin B-type domain-containing protein n=1 Tax=Platanthera guangdongensis TaxID=2320717 RepID=A0ABR2M1A9_9ASPA
MSADIPLSSNNSIIENNAGGHEQLCTLCEAFTSRATNLLNKNKTQSEILDSLHYSCSLLPSLELKCVILVDYYSALFFASIDKIHPEEFCGRVGLCEISSVSILKKDVKCRLCHQVIVEVLLKLKDPDAQNLIIVSIHPDIVRHGEALR